MVESVELHGALNRQHILHVLNNANCRTVTFGIGADGAGIGVRYVMAYLTVSDILLECSEYAAKVVNLLLGFGKHVQHKAQGGLTAYAGKF